MAFEIGDRLWLRKVFYSLTDLREVAPLDVADGAREVFLPVEFAGYQNGRYPIVEHADGKFEVLINANDLQEVP